MDGRAGSRLKRSKRLKSFLGENLPFSKERFIKTGCRGDLGVGISGPRAMYGEQRQI